MRNLLKHIIKDFKNGESIEVYVIILIILFLVIITILGIDVFGRFGETIEKAVIFSCFLVLLTATLKNKSEFYFLSTQLRAIPSNGLEFLHEFPAELNAQIHNAKDLLFIGVALERTIITHYSYFQEKLAQKHKIRFLFVNPESQALEVALTRNYSPTDLITTKMKIQSNIESLIKLKKMFPEYIEIRVIDNSLTHGLTAINPYSDDGILYIENYPYKTVGGSLPKFSLKLTDEWFKFYLEEAEILWQNGKVVN
ncbi:MAG: hypothetical protein ABFC94_01190 [Syntrophomonas sp.]|jgi:hypothetical protein